MQALLATREPTSEGHSSSLLLAQLADLRAEDVARASDVVHADRDLDALIGPAHDGLALLEGGGLRGVRWPSAGLR